MVEAPDLSISFLLNTISLVKFVAVKSKGLNVAAVMSQLRSHMATPYFEYNKIIILNFLMLSLCTLSFWEIVFGHLKWHRTIINFPFWNLKTEIDP